MRTKFDEQLEQLNVALITTGALCEDAISTVAKALLENDMELAKKVKPIELEIDQKEREIESLCMRLLLQQQPVAGDLRQISSALKMITDLERIGDQTSDIAELLPYLQAGDISFSKVHIKEMAESTIKMVTDAIDSFVRQDLPLAHQVMEYDNVVDELFNKVKKELIQLIGEHRESGEFCIDLLMVAKYFERIGDHAVNVAEWVQYSLTGIKPGISMIYFLEDDNSIRELVVYTMNSTGFEAVGFGKPGEFWAAMERETPSLVLLDIMLPEEDGLQILKRLRADPATKKLPVMMLTAKDSEYDKVLGLDSGADDYVPKPFGMMELMARIKALLRRSGSTPEEGNKDYNVGKLYVSPSRHQVKVDGNEVSLTLKEFELLCFLLENDGMVLTRDKILARIWGYDFDGETRTVDVHVRTLRQKLGECGPLIETVRGVGYKIDRRE